MVNKPKNPTAQMLAGLLACYERDGDNRLNKHLTRDEIGETIRIAIECIEAENGNETE